MSRILRRWDHIPGAFATLEGLHEYSDRLGCDGLLERYSEADVTSEAGQLPNLFDADKSPTPPGLR